MSWGIGDRVGVAVGIGNISSFLSKSIQSRSPQPSLILDFAGTGTLDSRITFTRSTTGTYYNSSGVLSTAAINAARFDYNPSTLAPLGLLIEQSSTNLLLRSQEFNNAAWGTAGILVTADTTVAPDGTTTADTLTGTSLTNSVIFPNAGNSLTTSCTASIFIKPGTASFGVLSIWTGAGTNGANIWFNAQTGALTGSSSVTSGYTITSSSSTPVGNGFFRITISATIPAATLYWSVRMVDTDNAFVYTNTVGKTLVIWGAQLEALAFATSYIPTTTAQVTRAADNASMTGTNFSSWYSDSGQGTFYSELSFINNVNAYVVGFTSSFYTSPLRTFGGTQWEMFDGVSDKIFNAGSLTTTNTNYKVAVSWATGTTSSLYQNGSLIGTVTPAGFFTGFTGLTISLQPNGATTSSMRIKKITYYSTPLTNPQKQALTT